MMNIGNLHPVILHLPIGIFSFTFFIRFIFPRNIPLHSQLFRLLLYSGFVTAFLSAALGWLLSLSSEYEASAIELHKWTAVTFTVSAGCLCILEMIVEKSSKTKWLFDALFIFCFLLMIVTGHFGGSLTHGEGFLFENNNKENTAASDSLKKKVDVSDTSSALVYDAIVEPILQKKCEQCHNAKKAKGDFRLDTYDLLMMGGKSGKTVVAGSPLQSEMIKRILLEREDDKHMPPKGKSQLSEKEIKILHWWILYDANRHAIVKSVSKNDTIKPFVLSNASVVIEEDVLPKIKPADSTAIVELKKIGLSVKPVSAGSGFLQISAVNMQKIQEADLEKIKSIAENVLWIDLSNHPVSDKALSVIQYCNNVSKIDIRNTEATDAFVSVIEKLNHLESINLVGTKITNKGLTALSSHKKLKHIYCWGTDVTESGIDEFKKNYPEIEVVSGLQK